MKKIIVFFTILVTLNSCMDIFTTSVLSSFATDISDMTDDELATYVADTPLSEISEEDLAIAEVVLEESRVELTEENLDDPAIVEQYVEETILLLEINKEQADVEGLISDVLSIEDDDVDSDFMTTLLEDTERLENISTASEYAVDAYLVDPESLTSTDLVVGGVGLISDIIQDEESAAALEAVEDVETTTLEAAGFTAEEISDIQTASAMLELAEGGMGEDMASMFEGLPI